MQVTFWRHKYHFMVASFSWQLKGKIWKGSCCISYCALYSSMGSFSISPDFPGKRICLLLNKCQRWCQIRSTFWPWSLQAPWSQRVGLACNLQPSSYYTLKGFHDPLGLNTCGCLTLNWNLLSAGQVCGRRAGRTHSHANDQLATTDSP